MIKIVIFGYIYIKIMLTGRETKSLPLSHSRETVVPV